MTNNFAAIRVAVVLVSGSATFTMVAISSIVPTFGCAHLGFFKALELEFIFKGTCSGSFRVPSSVLMSASRHAMIDERIKGMIFGGKHTFRYMKYIVKTNK